MRKSNGGQPQGINGCASCRAALAFCDFSEFFVGNASAMSGRTLWEMSRSIVQRRTSHDTQQVLPDCWMTWCNIPSSAHSIVVILLMPKKGTPICYMLGTWQKT